MMRQKTYVLAKAILERKDVLFSSSENVLKPQIMKEKEDGWEAVRLEMIEQGFTNFERKSWRDVRNHDWQYLRRSAVAKYEHNQKPGVEAIPYNDVDKIVFEIMGNEVTPSNQDYVNGAIAASYNWLKTEDQHQTGMDGLDSLYFQNTCASTADNSFNIEPQQISTLLNSALAASASLLNRKTSWEANSPAESPKQLHTKQRTYLQQQSNDNDIEMVAGSGKEIPNGNGPDAELFKSLIASTIPNATNNTVVTAQNAERVEARPSVSSGVITSTSAPSRKRLHSSSSAARSIEDEIQEAKLQHILLQVKREEILLQQERAKLAQEESKLRQEQIKTELLERKLMRASDGNSDD